MMIDYFKTLYDESSLSLSLSVILYKTHLTNLSDSVHTNSRTNGKKMFPKLYFRPLRFYDYLEIPHLFSIFS